MTIGESHDADPVERIVLQCLDAEDPEAALVALTEETPELYEKARRILRRVVGEDGDLLPEEAASEGGIAGYRILRDLGSGGMGHVLLCEQREPIRRLVAIKVIKLGMDSAQVLQRFELERQVLAMMNHDAIAKVYDAGTTARSQPFFAMEYVPGVPITQYCDEKQLPIEERLRLFLKVCDGIQHAHQKGVIHRDLKPANVLVATDREEPSPKIIDFGLVRATDRDAIDVTMLTEAGQVLGTPAYMSPEQAAGRIEAIDTRTDVYALGVTLYELLTGRLPFSRESLRGAGLTEIHRIIREQVPQRPSSRIANASPDVVDLAELRQTTPHDLVRLFRQDLDWIVMRALEKEPERRYATAAELAEDIKRFLARQPVNAGPPSARYRLRKFVQRNRGRVIAGALIALTLVAGTTVSTVAMLDARDQAELAKTREGQARTAQSTAENERRLARKAERDAVRARRAESRRAYLANIAAASYALESGNLTEAGLRLTQCPTGMRGFEWEYLNASLAERDRALIGELSGHTGEIAKIALRPGTDQLISTSFDGTVRGWALDSMREVWRRDMPASTGGLVPNDVCLGFAVRADGALLATAHMSGSLRMLDAATGKDRWTHRFARTLNAVEFTPDGTGVIVVGNPEGLPRTRQFMILDCESKAVRKTWSYPSRSGVYGLRTSPDGKLLAEGSFRVVRLWELATGKLVRELRGHAGSVATLEFSRDGQRLLTAGAACPTVRVYHVATGVCESILHREGQALRCAAFGADEGTVYTAAQDGRIDCWDLATTRVQNRILGHRHALWSLTFDRENDRLVSAGEGGTIRSWRASSPRARHKWRGFPNNTQRLAIRADGNAVAAVSEIGHFQMWNRDGAADPVPLPLTRWDKGGRLMRPRPAVIDVATHPTKPERLAFAVARGAFRMHVGPDTKSDTSMPAGKLCFADSKERTRRVISDGEQSWRLCYVSDGTRVLSLSVRGTLSVWNPTTGTKERSFRAAPGGSDVLEVSPDGRLVLVAAGGFTFRIFAIGDGELVREFRAGEEQVRDAKFFADGTRLLTAEGARVRVRDATTGEILEDLGGHQGTVRAVSMLPDGSRWLSAGSDRTLRVWDPSDCENVLILRGHGIEIRSLAVAPDGKWVATGDRTGFVSVWRTDI